ncbi:MAG: biopolymer transporter ExbD [Myxococcota bacterium]
MSFGKKKQKKRGLGSLDQGSGNPTGLNLIALMDILSNIIFFLMASFGAQTLDLTSANKVKLPYSTSELALKMSLSVAVTMDELYVEDEPIGTLDVGKLTGLDENRMVPSLEKALKRVRADRLAKNERPKDEDEIVLFIADERLEFATIDRVMKTCARAGFTKFRFTVGKQ